MFTPMYERFSKPWSENLSAVGQSAEAKGFVESSAQNRASAPPPPPQRSGNTSEEPTGGM